MKYAPTSEQEVVVLFALLLPYFPRRFELDEVRQRFPDCLASEDGGRSAVRIEFELYASNFMVHGHDPNGCDLIVCWEDDLPGFSVQRLALRQIAENVSPEIIARPIHSKYPDRVWTEETYLPECLPEQRLVQAQLLEWARSSGQVVFGKGPKIASWTFSVTLRDGQRYTLFGVLANGKMWPIWKELPPEIAEPYKEGLRLAYKFKAAIESGKAWCHAGIQEEGILSALRAGVNGVTSRIGESLTR